MSKHWLRSIGLGSLLAVGVTLVLQPSAPAQDNEKAVDIISKAGKFFFKEDNVTIKMGQSIKWVPLDAGTHSLVATEPAGAFEPTGSFSKPKTAIRKFDKEAKEIKYHCIFHKETMKGTIKVEK